MHRGTLLFLAGRDGSKPYIDALTAGRFTVLHAERPDEGLRLAAIDAPDVVVTEIRFADADGDGPSVIRALRARVDDATSIVVFSEYARATDRDAARAAGADLFVAKPALPSALVFEAQRALILRRGGRRLSWNWPRGVASVTPVAVERRRASSQAPLYR
jgi:CheY-like chemotaxis protein